jgi:hypothetical protein
LSLYPALLGDAVLFVALQKVGLAEPQLPLYVTLVRQLLHPLHNITRS